MTAMVPPLAVPDPSAIVDLVRHPIGDAAVRARAARQLREDGVAIIPGFVRADCLAALLAECDDLALVAHRSEVHGTPYLAPVDESAPVGSPRRALVRNALEVVAYDQFPSHSILRALYEWDELLAFVAAVLGVDELHRYADPFGALNLSVMRDGDELGWHFDQTDFVVSLAIRSSDVGGEFENAPFVRDSDDTVADVLAGRTPERVRTEPMDPGALMIFAGRTSLHRVTPIGGPAPRYVALLAYDTKPGTDSTDLLKRVRYGRLPGEPPPERSAR
jgi:hypothetical protein